MTDLLAYAALLEDALPSRGAAPVEKWDPPYRGDIDLTIRRDGVWIHEGAPIARAPLVRLFSTVLKREGERFFLVTPHEKLAIKVEDAEMARMVRDEGLEVMKPEAGTRPRVYYRNLWRYTTCFIGGSLSAEAGGVGDCVEGAEVRLLKDGRAMAATTSDNYGDFKLDRLDENSGR